MPGSSFDGARYEQAFQSTAVDLIIPDFSSIKHDGNDEVWYQSIQKAEPRQVSFLGR